MTGPAPLPDSYYTRRGVGPNGERVNPDGSTPNICEECGVDHDWGMADLSHGIIRLIIHAQELVQWKAELGYAVNGDMIARQRAGILGKSLLFSTTDPEDIDWEVVAAGPSAVK